jgi:hypothetical protein
MHVALKGRSRISPGSLYAQRSVWVRKLGGAFYYQRVKTSDGGQVLNSRLIELLPEPLSDFGTVSFQHTPYRAP